MASANELGESAGKELMQIDNTICRTVPEQCVIVAACGNAETASNLICAVGRIGTRLS